MAATATFSDWVTKWINQLAHVGWGAFLTLAISQHTHTYYAALAVLAAATVKEAIVDPLTETVALQGSGFEDWAFWCLGIAVGLIALIH
jgi:hypothetical protein